MPLSANPGARIDLHCHQLGPVCEDAALVDRGGRGVPGEAGGPPGKEITRPLLLQETGGQPRLSSSRFTRRIKPPSSHPQGLLLPGQRPPEPPAPIPFHALVEAEE